jgi:PAS domain S-box-containing protein
MSTPPIRRTPALAPVTGSERGNDDGFLELVATAEAPREIRRFLDRVADASPVILYVFDLALNRLVYCNDAVEPILGYTPDDIQGMGATLVPTLVHPDDRPTLPTRMARLAAASDREVVESEYRLRHAGGDWRWLAVRETFFARDGDGAPRQVLGAALDVTVRKLAEIALRDGQRRYELATAAGRVVVWDFDVASGRMRVEPPFPALLGFAPGEYDDPDAWEEYIHPDDHARVRRVGNSGFASDAPRDADGNSRCPETEYRALGQHGATYWVTDRGTVWRRPDGEPFRAVGTITDITDLKRVEDELRTVTGEILRAQDDERRRIASDLHDGVAQDLAAITINLMRIDAMSPDLSEEARSVLAAAQELGEQALRELRTLSYLLHPPLLAEGGLPDAIRDYAHGFAKRTGIAVDVDDLAPIGGIGRDAETALYRVAQECLVNIQRHSGSASAAIRLGRERDEIILAIRDHGRGMDAGRQEETDGIPVQTGVGIASMRERVRCLGGRLRILSGPGGTTVIARLPDRPALPDRAEP